MTKLNEAEVDDLTERIKEGLREATADITNVDYLKQEDVERFLAEVAGYSRERLKALSRLSEQRQDEENQKKALDELKQRLEAVEITEEIDFEELESRLIAGKTEFVLAYVGNKPIVLSIKLTNPSEGLVISVPRSVKNLDVCGQYDVSGMSETFESLEGEMPNPDKVMICNANDAFQDKNSAINEDWRDGVQDFMDRKDKKTRKELESGTSAVTISETINKEELIKRLEKDGQIFVLSTHSNYTEPESDIQSRVLHFYGYSDDGSILFHMRDINTFLDNSVYGSDGNINNIGTQPVEDWESYFGVDPNNIHVLIANDLFADRMQAIRENPEIEDDDLIM